jgi:4'-phosphopantetheinyl transferase
MTRAPMSPDLVRLDGEEWMQKSRYRFASDADRFVYRRVLTRLVVAQAAGVAPTELELSRHCRLCGHPTHGKPRLVIPGSDLEFSVACTGTVVAIALSSGSEVGIDIERMPDESQRSSHALCDSEGRGALQTWTKKESLLKAIGVGLGIDPNEVHVSEPRQSPAVTRMPRQFGEPGAFRLCEFSLRPDIIGHICLYGAEPDVVLHDASGMLSADHGPARLRAHEPSPPTAAPPRWRSRPGRAAPRR